MTEIDRRVVVIGFVGAQLDGGGEAARWEMWRPTVALCQHDDMLVSRFELLTDPRSQRLAGTIVEDIATVSPETEVRVHEMPFADPWDFEEVYGTLHDFLRAFDFRPDDEDYLAHITTGTHVMQICLFLLTESRHLPGRLLQTSPQTSRKRQHGSLGDFRIIDLDLSKYDRLAARFQIEQQEVQSFLKAGIETRSENFNRLIERIEKVALNSKSPILLNGPTGAGKSQLARRIFELKKHRGSIPGSLVEVNCAVLRGDQAMSALFGHIKGAFTGAAAERPGLLKTADKGLLFLDEIGELGVDEQAMLLRALEEKLFLPVGSDREVASDFQLIAGTNRDLRADVVAGRFREDLLARINLWTFTLPGLAERREDIEPNVAFELARFAEQNGRQVRFNREALDRFLSFAKSDVASWSANFRDLNAAMIRMATLSDSGRITRDVVDEEVERLYAQVVRLQNILGDAIDRWDS